MLFCKLSPHRSCTTNTIFDHIAIDLLTGCFCTSETCWAANPSCSRTETVLVSQQNDKWFFQKKNYKKSLFFPYYLSFSAFFLPFFLPHLTLVSLYFAPSTKLTLTLSLQRRLSVRRNESSRDLRELWHGVSYLVSSLHGRQLERHYEGTNRWQSCWVIEFIRIELASQDCVFLYDLFPSIIHTTSEVNF